MRVYLGASRELSLNWNEETLEPDPEDAHEHNQQKWVRDAQRAKLDANESDNEKNIGTEPNEHQHQLKTCESHGQRD